MNNKILRVLPLLALATVHINKSHIRIQGPGQEQATFTQSFKKRISTATNDAQSSFFIASDQSGAGEYAVSRVGTYYTFAEPLTPEKISLNDKKEVDNPLYNGAIDHLALLCGNRLVIVPKDQPIAYLVENVAHFKNLAMAATNPLHDANGIPAEKIVGACGTGAPQDQPIGFFAVKSVDAPFGTKGSGIALAVPYETKIEEENPETKEKKEVFKKIFEQLAGQQSEYELELRSVPLNVASDVIKIGNDLAEMGQLVTMHYNTSLGLLYIGLQTKAGSSAHDGARAIVVGYLTKDRQLKLHQIVAEEVFTNGLEQEIVGSKGAHTQVAIHQLKSMHTSTSLDYLIVQGGNQTANINTRQMIYALPLVNMRTERGAPDENNINAHGQIADKDAIPEDIYSQIANHLFLGRRLRKVVTSKQGLVTAHDQAAIVGGGALQTGEITDLAVHDDVVFATVAEGHSSEPGIFFSRALFDEYGRIKGWSKWARASAFANPVWGIKYNTLVGSFIALTSSAQDADTVIQTTWSAGESYGMRPLIELAAQQFPKDTLGIHGLFDFPMEYRGLSHTSLMIATGSKKVMLVETSCLENDKIKIHQGADFAIENCCDAMQLDQNPSAKILWYENDDLKSLGAITHATIASGTDSKIFVSGTNGLAVLCDDNGRGWSTTSGLLPSFTNLRGMSFKKIGSYRFVRKIAADEQFLYVLTDFALDRIDLTQSNFATGNLVITRIAQTTDGIWSRYAVFLDVAVSNKLALLATSNGLYRIGNNKDCREVQSSTDCDWTLVTLPLCTMPITHISPISSSTISSDFAKNVGGMLYVLAADRGSNRSRLYRLSIKNVTENFITDETVLLLPDIAMQNSRSNYANLGSYRNALATDGTLVLNTQEKELSGKLILDGNARGNRNAIPLDLNDFNQVSSFVRNSARGCWMISGDFGLRVHE